MSDKIAAHRYRQQDHSTIYGNAYCWCGWSTPIVNSHKTAIALWAEHVDAVLHPTIETVEELDALPPGSVVLDDDGMVYGYGATGEGDYAWYRGDDYDMPGLPALVIYTPEDCEHRTITQIAENSPLWRCDECEVEMSLHAWRELKGGDR